MPDVMNSSLMEEIFSTAEDMRKECDGKYVVAEFILLAAIETLTRRKDDGGNLDEEGTKLLQTLDCFAGKESEIKEAILSAGVEKSNDITGKLVMQKIMYSAMGRLKALKQETMTADVFLDCVLKNPTEAIARLIRKEGKKEVQPEKEETDDMDEDTEQQETAAEEVPQEQAEPVTISTLIADTKKLQEKLNASILGQAHAVATFVSGYFQSSLFSITDKERVRPMATFLFAGPPGVGKTFLAEEAAKAIGLPFRRFDMSEYASSMDVEQLTGADKMIVNSSEGLLTGFVAKHPRCVLLFDEIEKAYQSAIYLFLQVLDAGQLRDSRTNKEVSFKDTILIFTTNAGRNLYDGEESGKLSSVSRKVILSALRKDINPATREPYFPAAICSRFASGNVVMFNHLDAHDLQNIIDRRLQKHSREIEKQMGIHVTMDALVPPILLMAEGAQADARTVKSRGDSFWGEELYELFRLAASGAVPADLESVKEIRIGVDLEKSADEVRSMLAPQQMPEAIAFTGMRSALDQACRDVCTIHYVDDAEAAKEVFRERDIQFFICDAPDDERCDYLNREDKDTPARDFLFEILANYGSIPVYILEDPANPISQEERLSYIRRGVQDFMQASGEDEEVLRGSLKEAVARSIEQYGLNELARANKVLSFETAQQLSQDGSVATISMFDLDLEVAVDAEDKQNMLSAVSRPDTRFDQVIGAEDAKKELKYFVSYLQNPKKFSDSGVGVPKGVILYGPPGTGKTMLAKAMAGETGITFIAAEGNQFLKKYLGEGEEYVHRLFAMARKYAPAILFVDEIDAIGSTRTGSEHSQLVEPILTAFLAEMDGFSKDPRRPVFVLAATNYSVDGDKVQSLDSALVRRFDRRIFVDLPDKNDRKTFLEREIGGNPIFDISQGEIDSLVERSGGMSLALLASVLELALRTRIRDMKEKVDDKTLEEAYETFNSGERKEWDKEQVLRTARHEAGHAFLNWYGGETPSYVTIVSRGNFGGYMQHAENEGKMILTRRELLNRIRTAMGGRAAEIVMYGPEDGLSTGASGDLAQATSTAMQLLCAFGMDDEFGMATIGAGQYDGKVAQELLRPEINRILKAQLDDAVRLISANKPAIDALVDRLLVVDHLNGDEIDSIFSQHAHRE